MCKLVTNAHFWTLGRDDSPCQDWRQKCLVPSVCQNVLMWKNVQCDDFRCGDLWTNDGRAYWPWLDKNVQKNVQGRLGPQKSVSKAFLVVVRKEIYLTTVRRSFKKSHSRNFSHRNRFWTFLKPNKCPNSDFFHRTLLEMFFWSKGTPFTFPWFSENITGSFIWRSLVCMWYNYSGVFLRRIYTGMDGFLLRRDSTEYSLLQ